MMTGRFMKLEDGTWGVKVRIEENEWPNRGDVVLVTKSNGEEKEVELGEIVTSKIHGDRRRVAVATIYPAYIERHDREWRYNLNW